ncbi:MAG TPA: adenylate/guanylate cyclase domain-containing protein [Methylomirabilota bacterium]|nr:adenylate/guanylate cyclase domain-containing protein [Methylomirabilota bacterium]
MTRIPLTTKIGLVIVAVLIIGFGASTILTIQQESALLVDQNKQAARRLTEAIIASIESAMVQERPDITRMLISDLKSSPAVSGLGIYRRNGVEAFTDLATLNEVEKNAGLSKEVFDSIAKMERPAGPSMAGRPMFQAAVETLQAQEVLEQRDGDTLFTVVRPVLNQEKCQGCHGSDHRVRAVVRVASSMEPVFAEVRKQRNRQILVGLLTILAASGVLWVAMRHVVVKPVREVAGVARRIGAGDFAARVKLAGPADELHDLGGALNEMSEGLARARDELSARNAELAQTLESLQASRRQVELLQQLKGELSKFVPDAVKALLERDPNATELEKRTEEVSVLFLDIAGYTKLSEQLPPAELNQLVQTYFSSFLEIIRAHHGDVNETAGDGLMVIFQLAAQDKADRSSQDHAVNATRAAFAIRQKTVDLNEQYRTTLQPIALHMGINSGEALVGATKLGGAGAARWTFTATGPVTNQAARFAGFAQGGEIIVGPKTAERIRGLFVLEALGPKTFKNVSEPIPVFRLIPPGVYEKIV